MKYALVSTKPSIFDFALIILGLGIILFLLIGAFDLFLLICFIAILIGLLYRTYEFFFKAYPVELETAEKEIIIHYDKPLERRVPYDMIKKVIVVPHETKPYDRLLIYLASPMNTSEVKYSKILAISHNLSAKVVKDIQEKMKETSKLSPEQKI